MEKPKISLVASAVRTFAWQNFYDSLKGNKYPIEVVFAGNKKPDFELPSNFKYIYSAAKPCQCYEIAVRNATGELVGWTADDVRYNHIKHNSLDISYDFYKSFNDPKVVVAMRSIEDGRDLWNTHRFFGGWTHTPLMAPLGLMNREFLMEIGGYDRNFISGQGENDIVMRAIEAGGKCEMCMDGYLFINHNEIHHKSGHHASFRQWYDWDRQFLEKCWIIGGYGKYHSKEQSDKRVQFSPKRLLPVESFVDENIITATQGPKGDW